MSVTGVTHETAGAPAAPRAYVEVRNPAPGEAVGSVPVHTPAEVRDAVLRAREAQADWGELQPRERCGRLRSYHRTLAPRIEEVTETVRSQVEAARAAGARVLSGGEPHPGPGRFYPPTVLSECTQAMEVMREESFGPVLPVMRVDSVQEAVELANQSHLGLNAYVFAGSAQEGRRIAERIRAGSVLVGDVIYNYALPELPFGGIKASGIGRSHGEEGLRSMCEARLISYNRVPRLPATKLLRYPYSETKRAWMRRLLGRLFGR
jgi:succinate-semialdehyde dehydrogenase/glutarate-semialdehyde dehydrogenase